MKDAAGDSTSFAASRCAIRLEPRRPSQPPVISGDPPQARLLCGRPVLTGMNDGDPVAAVFI
jgi:hypothetical protein